MTTEAQAIAQAPESGAANLDQDTAPAFTSQYTTSAPEMGALPQLEASAMFEGWITTEQAAALTGYVDEYLRRLARDGKVKAEKAGDSWLFDRADLLAYKARMEALGRMKYGLRNEPSQN